MNNQSCKGHPGVTITWWNGDLGCPLCAAIKAAAEANKTIGSLLASSGERVTREEMDARIAWLKEERDTWRRRAEVAELNPGRPYNIDEDTCES